MSLNSVNTNIGAQVALQSLNLTNSQLQATQKQISTGYRVADASDDGGAFAVAESVRSSVGALTTVNQQLGNAQGLVGTALSSLTSLSDNLKSAQSYLVQIADGGTSDTQRSQYVASYLQLVKQVANTVDGSKYNGQSLLGSASGAVAGTSKNVISSDSGSTITISSEDNSGLAATLASLVGATFSRSTAGVDTITQPTTAAAAQTAASTALTATTGATAFSTAQTALSNQLNQVGSDTKFLAATITSNSSKVDSLNAGLGALVDADLSKESARLQALQIRQQLGTQALSLANQAPQALLSLFK